MENSKVTPIDDVETRNLVSLLKFGQFIQIAWSPLPRGKKRIIWTIFWSVQLGLLTAMSLFFIRARIMFMALEGVSKTLILITFLTANACK